MLHKHVTRRATRCDELTPQRQRRPLMKHVPYASLIKASYSVVAWHLLYSVHCSRESWLEVIERGTAVLNLLVIVRWLARANDAAARPAPTDNWTCIRAVASPRIDRPLLLAVALRIRAVFQTTYVATKLCIVFFGRKNPECTLLHGVLMFSKYWVRRESMS